MSNHEKLNLLSLYDEVNSSVSSLHDYSENKILYEQELSIIKRVYEELEWIDLSDEMKQNKRREALIILDKWSYEEGANNSLIYERSIVGIYDIIIDILGKELPNNLFINRIKSIILIEKIFINEKKNMSILRHMDYYVWVKLFKSAAFNIPDLYNNLRLHVLNEYFIKMYKNWPKSPYKDL